MSHVALGVNGELRSIWLAKALLGWVAPSGRYGLVLAAAVFAHGMAGMDGDGLAGFGEDDADAGRRS